MKIMYKITIITSTLVIISLFIGSIFLNYYIKESNEFLTEKLFEEKKIHIEAFINEIIEDIELRLYDYAVWDDMFYNLNSKNTKWLKDNATYFLYNDEAYQIDLIYVTSYSEEYSEFYCKEVELKDFRQTKHWYNFINQDGIYITFERINNNLYLLSSDRIYDNSKVKSNGYYTMGKLIDDRFIKYFIKVFDANNACLKKLDSMDITYKMNKNNILISYPFVFQESDIFGLEINFDMSYVLDTNLIIFKRVANVLTSLFVISILILFSYLTTLSNQLNGVIENISLVIKGDYSVNLRFNKTKEMKQLSEKVNILAKTIKNKINEIKIHQMDTMQIIIQVVEEKDKYTRGHSERVSKYAKLLAEQFDSLSNYINIITQAALIHDIGKIGIKDEILNKPGKLTNEEYEEIKTHAVKGYKILADADYFKPIVDIVKHHHERYDGKGYPDGLKGDEISMSAKILAVADTFDAMTSSRVYRKAMNFETALELINKEKGKQFDPLVVDILLNSKVKLYEAYIHLHNSK